MQKNGDYFLKKILFVFLILPTLCYGGQGGEYVRGYLSKWLESHKYTNITLSEKGVQLNSVGLTLNGEIYGINELRKGSFYSVETQLSAIFKNGRKLEDFAAGAGKNPEEAFLDSLNNFCLTTLHPIYAELVDHGDPHVNKEIWVISGRKRNIFLSEWGQRGEQVNANNLNAVKKLISQKLYSMDLSSEIHWVKLVVSNIKGKIETVVLTIDGMSYEKLNQEIASYNWPKSKEFYMVKLFFVIGKA